MRAFNQQRHTKGILHFEIPRRTKKVDILFWFKESLVCLAPPLKWHDLFPWYLLQHRCELTRIFLTRPENNAIARFHASDKGPSDLIENVLGLQTIVCQGMQQLIEVNQIIFMAEVDMSVACLVKN